MTKEQKLRNARLRVAYKRWERQDARNGYTVYRHSKPAYRVNQRVRDESLFLLMLALGAVFYIVTIRIIGG